MIITREIFEQASMETIEYWGTAARWYFFTFEVRGSKGHYAPGQYEKWFQLHRQFMYWERCTSRGPTDQFLEWCSKAVSIYMLAGEPSQNDGNKPKE